MNSTMKKYTLLIALFFFSFFSVKIYAQYRFEEYDKLLKDYRSDSIQAILMQAELVFSAKLNDLRSKRRKTELIISKHASITAFNHVLWMAVNGKLSHSQKANSTMFSGKAVNDRLQFVRASPYASYAENIAFVSLAAEEIFESKDAAQMIGDEFFKLWFSSSGHKSNMLDADFRSHGIAFYYLNERIYATNVFLSR